MQPIDEYDKAIEDKMVMGAEEGIFVIAEDVKSGDKIKIGKDGKYYKVRPEIQTVPLTADNYHSLDNRYLTNSRIGDFLKCHRFFYERHISGSRPNIANTDALKVGKAVDTLIFDGEGVFRKNFIAVTRRSIKNPPTSVTELTEKQFEDVLAMGEVLKRQPAIIDLKNHTKQDIITMDMDLGEHFCGLAAMPDWWIINDNAVVITDLKTSYETNENKYHYKCRDFGYYRQLAVMKIIIKHNNPGVTEFFTYRHVGIEKDKDGIFNPFAFYLANEQIDACEEDIMNNILPAIKAEKEFLPKSVEWKDAPTVGSINEEF